MAWVDYFVVGPAERTPGDFSERYATKQEARAAAESMSKEHGKTFIIYRAIGRVYTPPGAPQYEGG